MVDVLFWVFFGAGFLVMLAMIVAAFLSVRQGRKRMDEWRELEEKSSLLRR